MDVQCERCKTEYEFDDALVSGRGTTVRCTSCGHQFKVRRLDAANAGGDQWRVRTTSGLDLTFLTLRELQRAILSKQLTRADVLTRGDAPPRTLGSIAELEPFFEGKTSSRPPPPVGGATIPIRVPTPPGVPVVGNVANVPKRTGSWGAPADPAPPVPPPRPKVDTLRPSLAQPAVPPPAPPPVAVGPARSQRADPNENAGPALQGQPIVNATPYAFGQAAMAPPGADDPVTLRRPTTMPPPVAVANMESSPPLPPPTQPVRRPGSLADDDPFPMSSWQGSAGEEVYVIPRRRRVGGWVVAFVLVMAVGVVGWVVAKQYTSGRTASARQLEPRALAFVTEGERALADGNLDMAQEDLDKASALAERDPRVLIDEARVAGAKADVLWLRLRLLPADAADDMRATKAQLAEGVARVRKAADDAIAVAPEDPAALRARVDALRLAGESAAARGYVSKITAQATQPETAYVLAALDLSDTQPLWTTVVDRLRLAAAGEGNAGRARAALVYALAKSGELGGAKAELAKLDAMTRPYPLLPALHTFLDRAGVSHDAGAPAASASHVESSALPSQPAPASPGAGGGSGAEPPGDSRGGMHAAGQAIRKGDWGRARQIYEALVTRNPNDSEALSGLGDVARAQGDPSGAIAAYKRALAVNPSYLPALLGVADTEWASGDRAGAMRTYKDIEDRFPEGTYPPYVKSRTQPPPQTGPASPAGESTPGSTAGGATAASTASPSATAAAHAAPPIDPDGL
jgi:predicted Zn finger-like uncharacterized protein